MESRKPWSSLLPEGLPLLEAGIIVAYVVIAWILETNVSATDVTSTVVPAVTVSEAAVSQVSTLQFDGTLDSAGNTISGAWSDSKGNSGRLVLSKS